MQKEEEKQLPLWVVYMNFCLMYRKIVIYGHN